MRKPETVFILRRDFEQTGNIEFDEKKINYEQNLIWFEHNGSKTVISLEEILFRNNLHEIYFLSHKLQIILSSSLTHENDFFPVIFGRINERSVRNFEFKEGMTLSEFENKFEQKLTFLASKILSIFLTMSNDLDSIKFTSILNFLDFMRPNIKIINQNILSLGHKVIQGFATFANLVEGYDYNKDLSKSEEIKLNIIEIKEDKNLFNIRALNNLKKYLNVDTLDEFCRISELVKTLRNKAEHPYLFYEKSGVLSYWRVNWMSTIDYDCCSDKPNINLVHVSDFAKSSYEKDELNVDTNFKSVNGEDVVSRECQKINILEEIKSAFEIILIWINNLYIDGKKNMSK